MKLIVGLGNPGTKYAFSRHNMGFLALDMLSQQEKIRIDRLRFRALWGEGTMEGQKVLLIKPQTYMNLSGEAVRAALDYYKLSPEHLIVIYDDADLPEGVLRIRQKGSAGGHNGIKSIIQNIGTDVFDRIKLGIKAPSGRPDGADMANFVLGDIPKAAQKTVFAQLERACDATRFILSRGSYEAMSRYNAGEPKSPAPPAGGDSAGGADKGPKGEKGGSDGQDISR